MYLTITRELPDTIMVFTVSLRMKECVRMSEVRMKLACFLADCCHAT